MDERNDRPMVRSYVKDFLRFFVCGPSSTHGWILWALLLPITLPCFFVFQFVIGCIEIMAGEINGTIVVDGSGGDGVFDEVSCRRREDIRFLLGQGDYGR